MVAFPRRKKPLTGTPNDFNVEYNFFKASFYEKLESSDWVPGKVS